MSEILSSVLLAIVLMIILGVSVFLHYTHQIGSGKRLTSSDISTLVLIGTIMLVVLAITAAWLLFTIFSPAV